MRGTGKTEGNRKMDKEIIVLILESDKLTPEQKTEIILEMAKKQSFCYYPYYYPYINPEPYVTWGYWNVDDSGVVPNTGPTLNDMAYNIGVTTTTSASTEETMSYTFGGEEIREDIASVLRWYDNVTGKIKNEIDTKEEPPEHYKVYANYNPFKIENDG